jgi:putative sterol carrier protein
MCARHERTRTATMARFLSPEWAEECDVALAGVELPPPGPDAGLAAVDGHFTVAQEVHGAPGGDVVLLLSADGGRLRFHVEPLGEGLPDNRSRSDVDVTIALSYSDAVALARGELAPAQALNDGRVRVRGDLSVLVAGQQMLDAARRKAEGLDAATTY